MRHAPLLLIGLVAGCSALAPAPPETATALAERLATLGIAYDRIEDLPPPKGRYFRFDEGIALIAEGLWVEIIRIEDQRTFGIAKAVGPLLTMAEAKAGKKFPGKPELYARQPFLIVVRQEPEASGVLTALDSVLPAQ